MINKFEILPNEIFHNIFSYLSWDEILVSFCSLNQRINSIIGSVFSIDEKGIIFNQPGLSYKTFSSILLPLILNSSFLLSNIKHIHFDGNNSISFELIYQDLFFNHNKQNVSFTNLKSLYITKCLLFKSLIEILSLLIEHQLNELTLTCNEDIYKTFGYEGGSSSTAKKEALDMFKQFLCQIFSEQCKLIYLTLDISHSDYDIHQCLKSPSHFRLNTISDGSQLYCVTLRCLKIHLDCACFLEDLIEHVPNLEQLSIHCECLERHSQFSSSNVQISIIPNGNWFNKVPKLEVFALKCSIHNDSQFLYLKWLLNNVNYVRKLEIKLHNKNVWGTDQTIWKSIVDSNFIRQYCLPDQIINLKYFYFYICVEHELLSNDLEKIINSFKIDPFFIDHQWTNVKCFYDEKRSYQHIFSLNNDTFQFSDSLVNYSSICNWLDNQHIGLFLDLSICTFLEQFDKLCPNITTVTIYPKRDLDESTMTMLLTIPFEMKQRNLHNQFRNVTKLRLGIIYSRVVQPFDELIELGEVHAKIFSRIISMTVQLKYISMEKLEWLLYITQDAFDDLRENALSTVRHAEFAISSCNFGHNDSIHIGKHLVPLLSTFMPNLQALSLWRPDDFPWTSIRPDFTRARYGLLRRKWQKTLLTSESITEHADLLESNLCQLFEQLKRLVYLKIYGKILRHKVEPYRLMAQNRFPNSQIDVDMSRFRLWI
ncbi:unnamed protein product [Rotaria magnacalcarata]|uniref:F-box domain-containing protein n=1 Tax=Rotaria magnacalcarata TaxID=392030 RepID=A0A815LPH9_9BILA|nr:unnamed protein product [Rotaria magnacalcarata]